MYRDRRATIRYVLSALGIFLLIAASLLLIGWEVRERNPRFQHLVGDKWFFRLHSAYDRVAAGLVPRDQDGDGISDGREFFWKTDPRKPRDHPAIRATRDLDGDFDIKLTSSADRYVFPGQWGDTVNVVPGERFQWRGRLQIDQVARPTFPAGFRLRITPSADGTISPPGGSLGKDALIVAVPPDGALAFDFQVQMPARIYSGASYLELQSLNDAVSSRMVVAFAIDNAATGESLGSIHTRCAWPSPALLPIASAVSRSGSERTYHLTFPSGYSTDEVLLLQAAHDEPNAVWLEAGSISYLSGDLTVRQALGKPGRPANAGMLKFRVLPLRRHPPDDH